jgi:hypothetical protein
MSDWKSEFHVGPSLVMYGTLGAILLFVLSACAAAIPFGVGAAVGTVVTNQNNKAPNYIPPRPPQ